LPWADVLVALAVVGALLATFFVAREFRKPNVTGEPAPIYLDLPHLGLYTLYSVARAMIAYFLSLLFAIGYGYWAARDKTAEKVLLPILDILQSLPVLTFMPGFMLSLAYLFPDSEVGLNLASILLIFTGQAWNMVFSFYHSMKTVPTELYEAGEIYRFGWWRRFSRIEVPFSTVGLVWNSMMSMAGGWFFLSVCESFEFKDTPFRLLGLGSYMHEAQARGNWTAMISAIVAMVLVIVVMNELIWRPAAVWALRFKVEDIAKNPEESRVLELLRRSQFLWLLHRTLILPVRRALDSWDYRRQSQRLEQGETPSRARTAFRVILGILLLGMAGFGLFLLLRLLRAVTVSSWLDILQRTSITLSRVVGGVLIGTCIMVPIGVWIALRPKLTARLQPVIQVAASFPAPMLFAMFLVVFDKVGITLTWGSILLLLAGTQWYILFNVLGGASAIPNELHEASAIYRWSLLTRWRRLYIPAIFPFLVTGWVTAAGGAWNTSILAEYCEAAASPGAPAAEKHVESDEKETVAAVNPRLRTAYGIGALVNEATEKKEFPILAAGALTMALTVVAINRLLWRRLANWAEERYTLNR
jgi:NitT/TauT family transport system permease protein